MPLKLTKKLQAERTKAENAILAALEARCHMFDPGAYNCGDLGIVVIQRRQAKKPDSVQAFEGFVCEWFDPAVNSLSRVLAELDPDERNGDHLRFPQAAYDAAWQIHNNNQTRMWAARNKEKVAA